MTIKAIETRYKGYHFRSRLEARWAVFFDHLGIAWEYEPEGYELPSGRYLPDFRTSSSDGRIKFWVEVKGDVPTDAEQRLMAELCAATDMRGYIVSGLPGGAMSVIAHYFDGDTGVLPGLVYASFVGGGMPKKANELDAIHAACMAAKSARFEHGAQGA